MKAVVFDIGQVLVRWDPHLAYLDALGSREAAAAFLERVDFLARNLHTTAETFDMPTIFVAITVPIFIIAIFIHGLAHCANALVPTQAPAKTPAKTPAERETNAPDHA